MRLLLVEDHPLFSGGLPFLLAEIDSTLTYSTASTLALALQAQGPFDLILLDLHLPDTSGFNGLHTIREVFDNTPVVMLSGEENTEVIRMAIAEGAMGFVPKSATPQVLVAAMRLILAGGTYLPPHAFAAWPAAPARTATFASHAIEATTPFRSDKADVARLTDRQLEVLMKAVQGKPNKVIARETALAEGTVKAHLSAAFRLINVSNRTEAVFRAAQLGLTMPGYLEVVPKRLV